jgi:hypothetical protein
MLCVSTTETIQRIAPKPTDTYSLQTDRENRLGKRKRDRATTTIRRYAGNYEPELEGRIQHWLSLERAVPFPQYYYNLGKKRRLFYGGFAERL